MNHNLVASSALAAIVCFTPTVNTFSSEFVSSSSAVVGRQGGWLPLGRYSQHQTKLYPGS